mgnify:CR=1 FL=1
MFTIPMTSETFVWGLIIYTALVAFVSYLMGYSAVKRGK